MKRSEFEQLVDKTFWGLETKYGFKKVETRFQQRSCMIRYQNKTTELILNYDLGSLPWITIADISEPETRRSSLDWLLVELGQSKAPTAAAAFFPTKLDEGQLPLVLQKQSEQLLEFGADMLGGNFSILPNLQKRGEKYMADCSKYAEKHKIKK